MSEIARKLPKKRTLPPPLRYTCFKFNEEDLLNETFDVDCVYCSKRLKTTLFDKSNCSNLYKHMKSKKHIEKEYELTGTNVPIGSQNINKDNNNSTILNNNSMINVKKEEEDDENENMSDYTDTFDYNDEQSNNEHDQQQIEQQQITDSTNQNKQNLQEKFLKRLEFELINNDDIDEKLEISKEDEFKIMKEKIKILNAENDKTKAELALLKLENRFIKEKLIELMTSLNDLNNKQLQQQQQK